MTDITLHDDGLDTPEEPIPVSLLTGVLGSGKTTVLNRLLAHPDMGETAVIVNEFGEIGLDHLLVESGSEDTVLLNSGCLCCAVRGDLIETMRRLFKRRARRELPAFGRLAVERTGRASGLLTPSPPCTRLVCGSCSSGRNFAYGFLQTSPRDDALAV